MMVYRQYHEECDQDCTRLTAYVRIDGKYKKIGYYGSECKQFEPLNLEKDEQERLQKERLSLIKSEIRKTNQENRERRKVIESEFNMNNSFFREQTKSYDSSK